MVTDKRMNNTVLYVKVGKKLSIAVLVLVMLIVYRGVYIFDIFISMNIYLCGATTCIYRMALDTLQKEERIHI